MLGVFEEGEVILIIVGVIVLFFIYRNRQKLMTLERFNLIIGSFFAFFVGWVFTIVEGLTFGDLFNFFEHGFYFIGSLILAIWIYSVFVRGG